MKKRLLVIGWDGATWDYIHPLLAEGRLKNLAQLLDRGAQAVLKSTIPPYTNVAWPSLVTGLHPAKTGIFGGARRQAASYDTVPTNLTGFHGVPLWQWANRFGLQAGVINVPMTYPASKLDGYMVTGFDSPRRGAHLTYPSNLLEDWAASGHAYHILEDEIALMEQQNPHQKRGDLSAFVEKWVELTIEQGRFIRWLWQERAVPLLFTVFTGTDSINHRTRDFEQIARVYEAADEALGVILSAVEEDTLVCLVSDHGSTPAFHYIALYRALADAGWLHFRPQVASRFWKRLPSPLVQFTSSIWRRLPDRVRQTLSWPLLQLDPRLAVAYNNIDWTKTTVYARSGMGALYFNRAGREPAGRVTEEMVETVARDVKSALLALKDAQGESLFEWVKDGRDVYPGANEVDDPPDLVFQHARKTDHVITGFTTDPLLREIPDSGEYGTHTLEGIFAVAGPGVRADLPLQNADIVDVVPTLLAASGLPIPDHVDGRARVDLFREPIVPQFAPAGEDEQKGAEDAAGAADEVMERLRNLGYL